MRPRDYRRLPAPRRPPPPGSRLPAASPARPRVAAGRLPRLPRSSASRRVLGPAPHRASPLLLQIRPRAASPPLTGADPPSPGRLLHPGFASCCGSTSMGAGPPFLPAPPGRQQQQSCWPALPSVCLQLCDLDLRWRQAMLGSLDITVFSLCLDPKLYQIVRTEAFIALQAGGGHAQATQQRRATAPLSNDAFSLLGAIQECWTICLDELSSFVIRMGMYSIQCKTMHLNGAHEGSILVVMSKPSSVTYPLVFSLITTVTSDS
ncbi:hypothetical protein U9M48_000696, partial [Paspalum notatum var. saurae]